MENQVIIAVGREFGSGGHEIAQKLAEKLQIKLYDRALIEATAKKCGYEEKLIEKYDEKPVNRLFSKNINGHTNSLEKHVAMQQFKVMKELAQSGESFVIVGRCAEAVLKDYPRLISFFILGDEAIKMARVQQIYKLSEGETLAKMKRHDRKRKAYHNDYANGKWGASRNYDLTINSSRLGIDETVELLYQYIQTRIKQMEV